MLSKQVLNLKFEISQIMAIVKILKTKKGHSISKTSLAKNFSEQKNNAGANTNLMCLLNNLQQKQNEIAKLKNKIARLKSETNRIWI